jgi:hypothetical protein
MPAVERKTLERRWVHSHEDDTEREIVFRPADYRFPPSRGRRSFELGADGTLVEQGPGPADAPFESRGTWTLEGNELILRGPAGAEVLHVASVDDDRLVVRR